MLIRDDGIELSAVLETPENHDGRRLVILLLTLSYDKDFHFKSVPSDL